MNNTWVLPLQQEGVAVMEFPVDKKQFRLAWAGLPLCSLMSVTEIGIKRSFRCFISKEGGAWLAARLRRVMEKLKEESGGFSREEDPVRLRDFNATMISLFCQNA